MSPDQNPNPFSFQFPEDIDGGGEKLRALLRDFYDRIYSDAMIGFFFLPHDKEKLIAHQYDYLCARLGDGKNHIYHGKPMRSAHRQLPILEAHFDRRHMLLKHVLDDHHIKDEIKKAWLNLDLLLKPLIVKTGHEQRKKILK